MIPVGWLVPPALALPPLARFAPRRLRMLGPGLRRALGQGWHLATLLLWGALALDAGRSRGLLFLAGLLWVETWFLSALTRHPHAREPHPGSPHPDAAAGGSPPRLAPAVGSAPPPEEESERVLQRILLLEAVPVDEVMAPREQICWVDGNATIQETLDLMRSTGRSRLLAVAGGSLDRVLGVAHAKDRLPLAAETGGRGVVRPHLRRALRVPSGQTVAGLLEQIRRDRVHLCVISDPLSRTLGVVTLKDIYRHITAALEAEA